MIQLLIWKFFVSSSFFFLKAYCSSKKQVTFMFKLVDAIYCWSGAVSPVYVIILHKLYYLFKKTDKSQNSGLCFDNWLS